MIIFSTIKHSFGDPMNSALISSQSSRRLRQDVAGFALKNSRFLFTATSSSNALAETARGLHPRFPAGRHRTSSLTHPYEHSFSTNPIPSLVQTDETVSNCDDEQLAREMELFRSTCLSTLVPDLKEFDKQV